MKKSPLPLQSARLRNFKAVRDSRVVKFTPLTAFIGNNGSGKSSLIEGLEALRTMVLDGIDDAMRPFRGFEHIWNKAVTHEETENDIGVRQIANPMELGFVGWYQNRIFPMRLKVTTDPGGNKVYFSQYDALPPPGSIGEAGKQILFNQFEIRDWRVKELVYNWQFLSVEPTAMLYPRPQRRSSGEVRLARNGANIAEYLLSIHERDESVLKGIVETLAFVLPYAGDVRPAITSELERNVYLLLKETSAKAGRRAPAEWMLPSWLLSQGTLRILCLLAVFRHPSPPSVVFVEEIENGLDPRTIHLVVDEIRSFLLGGGQVVITTHSPYLLDLLDISQIVVVERAENGEPEFRRPTRAKLKNWAGKFAPGRLYTMGSLTKN